ncbi:MAG: type II toxin-antitoxin system RelE/ParE family toxin [Undibacterium sp.]|nr:type II toxin-antitoxin system RelE/ParE family toxin [Opitutaceae bacterium]
MKLGFHPAVQRDFNAAISFYDQVGPAMADRFEAEMRAGLANIKLNPRRYAYHQSSAVYRRFKFPSFPYVIVYRELADEIRVTVLKHERRDSPYGLSRW